MARISTYDNDDLPSGSDKVIGTDGGSNDTVNYTLDQIAAFVDGEILPVLENGSVVLFNDGEYMESFITNNITTATVSHAYGNDTTQTLTRAIYLSDTTTIAVGSLVTGVFTNPIVRAGVRVVFTDALESVRFVRTVAAVDSAARTITITEPIATFADFDGSTSSNGSNQLLFVRNDGITLPGAAATGSLSSISLDNLLFTTTGGNSTITISGEAGTQFNLALVSVDPVGWITSGSLAATAGFIPHNNLPFTTTITIPPELDTVNRTFAVTATSPTNTVTSGLIRQQHTQANSAGNLTIDLSSVTVEATITFSTNVSTGEPPFTAELFDADPAVGSPVALQTITAANLGEITFVGVDTSGFMPGDFRYYVRVTDTDTVGANDVVILSEVFTIVGASEDFGSISPFRQLFMQARGTTFGTGTAPGFIGPNIETTIIGDDGRGGDAAVRFSTGTYVQNLPDDNNSDPVSTIDRPILPLNDTAADGDPFTITIVNTGVSPEVVEASHTGILRLSQITDFADLEIGQPQNGNSFSNEPDFYIAMWNGVFVDRAAFTAVVLSGGVDWIEGDVDTVPIGSNRITTTPDTSGISRRLSENGFILANSTIPRPARGTEVTYRVWASSSLTPDNTNTIYSPTQILTRPI